MIYESGIACRIAIRVVENLSQTDETKRKDQMVLVDGYLLWNLDAPIYLHSP